MKKLNLLTGILIGLILFNCSKNDDNETPLPAENELVGIWLRIDSNDTFDERFTFNSNQTGNLFFRDGTFNNSTDFTWSTQNNIVTFVATEPFNPPSAPYEINSNGQLVLANDPELTYNKVE